MQLSGRALGLRLRWLNLSGALLAALLQRSPVLRFAATAEAIVRAAPIGAVLRATVAAIGSLGALHTLAGATEIAVSTSSVNTTVGTQITPVAFVTTGAPTNAASYIITGLPPGLSVPGLNPANNILNISNPQGSGAIIGTPTTAGTFRVSLQAWEFVNATGSFSPTVTVLFTIAPAGPTAAPTITAQPVSITTAVGLSATFSVGVTANPSPTYQWMKNGVAITGATTASLTISDVKSSDAGNYNVSVTNSVNTVTSQAATLTVSSTATAPVITAHPVPVTVATGSTVVLTGAATAAPTPSYQWWRGPNQIAGATSATLVLTGTNAIAGTYSLVASNAVGTASSTAAAVGVINTTNPGHLINLSILTPLTTGETMTMGTAIAGGSPGATKALLARAVGPSLASLGLTGVLPDPKLSLISASSGSTVAENNDWGGTAALVSAFSQVGAFPYANNATRDAAVFLPTLATGNYTARVSDNGAGTGTVIAEIYDATPAGTFTTTTPRLINVSVLKQIATSTALTAGFVVGGETARTVLVRAIGPGLTQFGLGGVMPDPKLTLFNTNSVAIADNDNWGGDAQLTAVAKSVGAFAIDDAGSRDAMLLITLAPGNYSAAVSPTGSGGNALVEVYEVP